MNSDGDETANANTNGKKGGKQRESILHSCAMYFTLVYKRLIHEV